jgi:dihydrofolate reductase
MESNAACPQEEDIFIIEEEKSTIRDCFSDKIELTLVHHSFEADAFFPQYKRRMEFQQSENI